MTDGEARLMAAQALEISELRAQVAAMREDMSKARMLLVGIGGPLNDNVLEFNAQQRGLLHRVEALLQE